MASASSSIAAITACSASSAYGGRRCLYGSAAGAEIEDSTSELDIFPRGSLPIRVPQERGRVIRDDQGRAVVSVHLAAQLPDGLLRVQQRLRGEGAPADDDLRLDELELPDEVRAARRDLVGRRVAVAGRAVLEHVGDEHILAPQLDRRKDLRQQLAARADERASRLVLGGPGSLADTDEVGVRVALARDGIGGR